MHAGDLPPILSANGIGILSTFTNRFTVNEVIGKSFIHQRALSPGAWRKDME